MTTTTNAFTPLSNAGMMENPDRTLLTVQMQEISFPRMSENRVGIIYITTEIGTPAAGKTLYGEIESALNRGDNDRSLLSITDHRGPQPVTLTGKEMAAFVAALQAETPASPRTGGCMKPALPANQY